MEFFPFAFRIVQSRNPTNLPAGRTPEPFRQEDKSERQTFKGQGQSRHGRLADARRPAGTGPAGSERCARGGTAACLGCGGDRQNQHGRGRAGGGHRQPALRRHAQPAPARLQRRRILRWRGGRGGRGPGRGGGGFGQPRFDSHPGQFVRHLRIEAHARRDFRARPGAGGAAAGFGRPAGAQRRGPDRAAAGAGRLRRRRRALAPASGGVRAAGLGPGPSARRPAAGSGGRRRARRRDRRVRGGHGQAAACIGRSPHGRLRRLGFRPHTPRRLAADGGGDAGHVCGRPGRQRGASGVGSLPPDARLRRQQERRRLCGGRSRARCGHVEDAPPVFPGRRAGAADHATRCFPAGSSGAGFDRRSHQLRQPGRLPGREPADGQPARRPAGRPATGRAARLRLAPAGTRSRLRVDAGRRAELSRYCLS